MPRSITMAQLSQIMSTNPVIIDIRDPYQYAQFHIQTADNIPNQNLVMYQ